MVRIWLVGGWWSVVGGFSKPSGRVGVCFPTRSLCELSKLCEWKNKNCITEAYYLNARFQNEYQILKLYCINMNYL